MVTDIAPIHGLVAQVMGDLGTPELVVTPGTSPHHHAMRPSEARMLTKADAVIWVGPALTRWLEEPIETLAPNASVLTLLESDGLELLPFRAGEMFGEHDHGAADHDDHDAHDDHKEHADHDAHKDEHDHDEHDHDKHADHDAHSGHDDHADHAPGSIDPHIWLSPANAGMIVNKISVLLSDLDPDNAETYAANATIARAEIARAAQDISEQLTPLQNQPFVVLHDGFHYFEHTFGVEAIGAITDGHEQTPGAARMAELREKLAQSGLRCAFIEPGASARLLDTATEGMEVRRGVLDPLGVELTPGPALYVGLIRAMGDTMAECLAD